MLCMANQGKIKLYHHTPKFKFGFWILKKYNQAITLDDMKSNHKWRHYIYIYLEVTQLDNYVVFTGLGRNRKPPPGFNKRRYFCMTSNMTEDTKQGW